MNGTAYKADKKGTDLQKVGSFLTPCITVISIRQDVIIPARANSGIIEINKLDRKQITNNVVVLIIVVKRDIAAPYKVKDPLLAHHPFRTDQKLYNNIFPDILRKDLLH